MLPEPRKPTTWRVTTARGKNNRVMTFEILENDEIIETTEETIRGQAFVTWYDPIRLSTAEPTWVTRGLRIEGWANG